MLLVAGGAALGGLVAYGFLCQRQRRSTADTREVSFEAPSLGRRSSSATPKADMRHFPVRPPLRKSMSLPVAKMEDETVRVVCYGDSNTWGYDAFSENPDSEAGSLCRFGEAQRWPRVAAALLGSKYAVVEEGLNGRTTMQPDPMMTDYDANGRAAMPAILRAPGPHKGASLDLQFFFLAITYVPKKA